MVKTNYSGLNPVVVQVLNNLQYRYSGETPEMWCSRVHYPFKKLLEYNPKYFSKNGFIQMIERSYKDGNLKLRDAHFIFIALVSSELSDNKIEKIYQTCGFIFSKCRANFSYAYEYENRKRYINCLIDSAKVIQWTWRAFKLRPET
ncbi:hypothetical protein RhiirA5_412957 [Rhizophagus irregularis]|uniref:Uncharacterized protein n=1 Tax=Rhizophagus irregularis TaxID=588596 RepID=A0A2N0PXG5_9GLOM|nr:hypothetical protein RhiirA5_412957 [Rhizophagus irregularis]